jgi:hypothetical protein
MFTKTIPEVDWQDEAFGQHWYYNHSNVKCYWRSKVFTYKFWLYLYNEKAIVLNSNYKRHILTLKAIYKITKDLRVGGSIKIY